MRIDWLYVHESFRGRNLADYLLGELVALCHTEGIRHISVDIPAQHPYKLALTRLFATWQFTFDVGEDPDIYIRAEDVSNLRRIGELKKGIRFLSSLTNRAKGKLLRSFLLQNGYRGYLFSGQLPKGYIDPELSCFAGTPDACTGLLLAHKDPQGAIRVEYLDCDKNHIADAKKLISAFLGKVAMEYEGGSPIHLVNEFPELSEEMNRLCPSQLGQVLIEGLLSEPDNDLNEKDVKKLLNAF